MPATCPLSSVQFAVLRRLARGRTYDQIALELGLATSTVRTHCHHIFRELGVPGGVQAALVALRERWVPLRDLAADLPANEFAPPPPPSPAPPESRLPRELQIYLAAFDRWLAADEDDERADLLIRSARAQVAGLSSSRRLPLDRTGGTARLLRALAIDRPTDARAA